MLQRVHSPNSRTKALLHDTLRWGFVVFWAIVAASRASAQPDPVVEWWHSYGDSCLGEYDDLWSCRQTRDGGFIMTGYTQRFQPGRPTQVLLVRTDSLGSVLWDYPYGGGSATDDGTCVCETSDGGFIVGGFTSGDYTRPGSGCAILLKVDSIGNQLWRHQDYGDSSGVAYAMVQTPDGGYALAGIDMRGRPLNVNMCLARTDSAGNLIWQRRYDAGGRERGHALTQTSNGNFVVAGRRTTDSSGHEDLIVVRTDSNGDTLWQRLFVISAAQSPGTVVELTDGSLLVCTNDLADDLSYWRIGLTKISGTGDLIWRRQVGTADSVVGGAALTVLPDGFAITGTSGASFNIGMQVYLAKTDLSGNLLWHRTITIHDLDESYAVIVMPDGSFVLAGSTRCLDGGGFGAPDFFLLRTGPDGLPIGNYPVLHPSSFSLSANPNPFNPATRITFSVPRASRVELSIFDLQGRHVETLVDNTCEAGEHNINFDGGGLPSGIYFARLEAREFTRTQKMVLLK